jgi:hypothetical protein
MHIYLIMFIMKKLLEELVGMFFLGSFKNLLFTIIVTKNVIFFNYNILWDQLEIVIKVVIIGFGSL